MINRIAGVVGRLRKEQNAYDIVGSGSVIKFADNLNSNAPSGWFVREEIKSDKLTANQEGCQK